MAANWHRYDYYHQTSASTSTSSTGYWTKTYNLDVDNIKIAFERIAREDQFAKYKEQLNEGPEPQTIFHFDPKGIVDKWPEKES